MATEQTAFLLHHLRHLAATQGANRLSDRELLARFAGYHDHDSFETLLHRHGPMVLRVCRRLLGAGPDAEDAFQATFLILARKAGSVRWQESIANWLYGVAYRVALKARTIGARRRVKEREARCPNTSDPLTEITGRELLTVLDAELVRLPAKYRTPLVLCYLEGATRDEAAQRLGCPLGTLKSRLERGRELLRTALHRRGWDLAAVLAATVATESAASSQVPVALLETTVRAAGLAAMGKTASGLVSASVLALIESHCRFWAFSKISVIVALMAVGIVGWSAAQFSKSTPAPSPTRTIGQVAAASKSDKNDQPSVDFFGDPLPPGAVARLGTSRWRPGGVVTQLAFSPDGKMLASGGWDGHFCLWETATGKVVKRYDLRHGGVTAFAFQPNGRSLAIAGSDPKTQMWDFLSGQAPPTFPPPETRAGVFAVPFPAPPPEDKEYLYNSFAISPDGKTLATGSYATVRKSMVRLWDMSTAVELPNMKMVRIFGGHDGAIDWMTFSADGTTLLSASHPRDSLVENTLCVWEAATGKELGRLEKSNLSANGPNRHLALAPDGRTVAVSKKDGTVRLWKPADGKNDKEIFVGGEYVAATFAPDGKTLATGSLERNNVIRFWDVATGQEVRHCQGEHSSVEVLAFSADGQVLASAGQDRRIRLWDVMSGRPLDASGGHLYAPQAIALSPDGRTAISGGWDDAICFWDTVTGKELRRFTARLGGVSRLALSPDGRLLAATGHDPIVRLWDAATGQEVRSFVGKAGSRGSVAFSPDGKKLVASGLDNAIRVWDVVTGKELLIIQGKDDQTLGIGVRFSPDGKTLTAAAVSEGPGERPANRVILWDAATGREIRDFRSPKSHFQSSVVFSPDGRFVAAGAMSGNWGFTNDGQSLASPEFRDSVHLWNVATGEDVRSFAGDPEFNYLGTRQVHGVLFSPDGKTLMTAEEHGAILLYETATGKLRRKLTGHHGSVAAIALTTDGRRLVSVSNDLTGLVWDMTKTD